MSSREPSRSAMPVVMSRATAFKRQLAVTMSELQHYSISQHGSVKSCCSHVANEPSYSTSTVVAQHRKELVQASGQSAEVITYLLFSQQRS